MSHWQVSLQGLLLLGLFMPACTQSQPKAQAQPLQRKLPLDQIRLPEGFRIALYADNVPDARSLARSPSGVLYVGNRRKDKVYALLDQDGDHYAEKRYILASGLTMPNGIAFYQGDLYVAEVSRLWRYPNIEQNLAKPPEPILIYEDYPSARHHGWRYIAFGPDNKLYIAVGAPCNICLSQDSIYASITRMNPDGSDREIYAHGVRNSVGLAFHPQTGALWFTENGRDNLGDDLPPCELNYAPSAGQHFGYPYCHGRDIGDPRYGEQASCLDFTPPVQSLGAHVAPLGLAFGTSTSFPSGYQTQVFIAEHGSWNRSRKVGYRISLVRLQGNKAISYEPFAQGWLDRRSQKAWGRPVDVIFDATGSLLVSDDYAGVIYRISYVK